MFVTSNPEEEDRWLDIEECKQIGNLLQTKVSAIRVHSKPRNKLFRDSKLAHADRMTVMMNDQAECDILDEMP